MPAGDDLLSTLGLEGLIADRGFKRERSTGIITSAFGLRTVLTGPEVMRSLYHILDREKPGAWSAALKVAAQSCGKKFAAELDARLVALGKPMLTGLPLEACLVFLADYFAVNGLGRLKLDLAHAADHGLIVAHLENSFFPGILPDVTVFTDPIPAGLLQGFFEHISGQGLGCDEIACARHGAPYCTFVLTAPERLMAVAPLVGHENAVTIIARLCA